MNRKRHTPTPAGLAGAVISVILLAGIFLIGCDQEEGGVTDRTVTTGKAQTGAVTKAETGTASAGPAQFSFGIPRKSPHYESNTPAHGAILSASPANVVINFNFDLAPPSTISIVSNGKEYGTGETRIDDGKLMMSRAVDPKAPKGLYEVSYTACWPDQTCHDGNFQFAID